MWGTRLALPALVLAACCELGEGCPAAGGSSRGQGEADLEKEMATHSSVLAWRIPGTGEPGGLPSMGSHRVGHN